MIRDLYLLACFLNLLLLLTWSAYVLWPALAYWLGGSLVASLVAAKWGMR